MRDVNKQELIAAICAQLEAELLVLKAAAQATYEAATGEESRPENEYDTRGLEASYLAGAQAKRVQEVEEQISLYHRVKPRAFGSDDGVGPSALVELDLDGKTNLVLMMPKGGGLTIEFQGQKIQIISPSSPLGEALQGLKCGDSAIVDAGNSTKEYEIVEIQ